MPQVFLLYTAPQKTFFLSFILQPQWPNVTNITDYQSFYIEKDETVIHNFKNKMTIGNDDNYTEQIWEGCPLGGGVGGERGGNAKYYS